LLTADFLPEHLLFRAIRPDQWIPKKQRPSSVAFADEELSVDWSLIHNPQELLDWWIPKDAANRVGAGVAAFKVGLAYEFKQRVIYNPLMDEEPPNPAHTLVIGLKSKPVARKFAKSVMMVKAVTTPSTSQA